MSNIDPKELYDMLKKNNQKIPPELEEMVTGAKRPKYNNKKTIHNGKLYDSSREAKRAGELELLWQSNEIAGVIEQFPFNLPGGVKYVADFVILNMDGTWEVEDAKGVRTPEYKIKAKLFSERFGQNIKEV